MFLKLRSRLSAAPSGWEHEINPITAPVEVMSFGEIALQLPKALDMLSVTSSPVFCRIFAIENVRWEILDDNQSIILENRRQNGTVHVRHVTGKRRDWCHHRFVWGHRGYHSGAMAITAPTAATQTGAPTEKKLEDAVRQMETADTTRDPEVKVYFARHYAQIGLIDSAIHALEQAAQLGFVCAPATLTSDVWLSTLGGHPEFGSLLNRAGTLIEEAKSSFERSPSST
jgi:hypothetical protein